MESAGDIVIKNLDVGVGVGDAQVVQLCQVLEVSPPPPENDFRFVAQINAMIKRSGIHVEHERCIKH
jgi:hypothetical protein